MSIVPRFSFGSSHPLGHLSSTGFGSLPLEEKPPLPFDVSPTINLTENSLGPKLVPLSKCVSVSSSASHWMVPPSVPSPTAQLVGTPDSSCFADINLPHPADSTSLSLLTALPFSPSPGPWSPLPRLLQLPLRSLAARNLDDHSVLQSAANVLCLQYRSDHATVLPKPSPGSHSSRTKWRLPQHTT